MANKDSIFSCKSKEVAVLRRDDRCAVSGSM